MIKNYFNKLYSNSSRFYLEEWVKKAATSLPPGSLVLDAGAGDCPYKPLFHEMKYESADFCQIENAQYGEITYVCDLSLIPVEDARYDLVLCTQVLLQLTDPLTVLKELHRVLKPGGFLWISSSLYYPELGTTYDYTRFTKFGFDLILKRAGFQVHEIDWLEGYYGTLGFQLKIAANALPISPFSSKNQLLSYFTSMLNLFIKPIFFLLAIYFDKIDTHLKYTQRGHCKNYRIVAIKPLENS